MPPRLIVVMVLAAVLAAASFLSLRLDFFGLRNRRGRSAFLGGIALVAISFIWQLFKLNATYADWFVPSVYLLADLLQVASATIGVILCGLGIVRHEQFWDDERRELQRREQMLGMLSNLQHDARQPYQLMELLDIFLHEVVSHLPNVSGAVFLANRTRRQFVLTASIGLSRDEIAGLEHYPLERNIVSQAVEMGEPLIAPGFDFIAPDGAPVTSRFQSVLVLPLIAGMEKVGGVLLFSAAPRRFDAHDAKYVSPVTEWLAERIRATRLGRELTGVRNDRDRLVVQLHALHDRVGAAIASLDAPDPLGAFCRALTGMFESTDVHLCSIRSGRFEFIAHGISLGSLSESYQTALIEAVDRHKPLLINQEATDDSGHDRVVASTLVMSLGGDHASEAVLFRRESSAMSVSEPSLQTLEVVARLAALAIDYVGAERRSLSQRTGFERVMRLLNPETIGQPITPEIFVDEILPAFPAGTGFLIFDQSHDDRLRVRRSINIDEQVASGLVVNRGEGSIGRAPQSNSPVVFCGKATLTRMIDEHQQGNRLILSRLIGVRLDQALVAICPLRGPVGSGTVVILATHIAEREQDEYSRLLTLAGGLYTLRATIDSRRGTLIEVPPPSSDRPISSVVASDNFPDVIDRVLHPARISGDLYMIAGRPREIHTKVQPTDTPAFADGSLQKLFEEAVSRFATLAADDDVISISVYQDASHVYLDISRHRRYFSPVEPVAGFGVYRQAADTPHGQPLDPMLSQIAGSSTWYAADTSTNSPAYLSFKFPRRHVAVPAPAQSRVTDRPCILVIDDQAVILDLVSAMCQTIGYQADVARSGEIGLRMAAEQNYALVLADLAMPGLSGLEVARALKSRKPDLPVVLMTGWEASLDRSVLSDAGIENILYKPFRIEQLSDLLRSVVKA